MKTRIVLIIRKASFCPCLISAGGIHVDISVSHQHLNKTTANKTSCSCYQHIASLEFLPRQCLACSGKNVITIIPHS